MTVSYTHLDVYKRQGFVSFFTVVVAAGFVSSFLPSVVLSAGLESSFFKSLYSAPHTSQTALFVVVASPPLCASFSVVASQPLF